MKFKKKLHDNLSFPKLIKIPYSLNILIFTSWIVKSLNPFLDENFMGFFSEHKNILGLITRNIELENKNLTNLQTYIIYSLLLLKV